MATFKTSAIVELIDKTKAGAASVISNFGKLEKAADGFGKEADKSADKASLSFKQFEFEQKKSQDRLNDLRRDLRNGKGDFKDISREIDDTVDSLKRLNRENRGFRAGRAIGRNIRRGLGGALRSLPLIGGGLAAAGAGALAVTSNFAKQADEAGRLADSVGVAVESYTALQFVVKQLAGEDGATALPDALKELNKRIGELKRGEGTLLGIDKRFQSILLSADGTEDAFVKIRREIQGSGIDTQELGTLLDKTFGEAGFRLTRLFQVSNEEFGGLVGQARELGVVLDEDAVSGGRKFLKELGEITTRVKAIGFQIGGSLARPLAELFDTVLEPRLKNFQAFIEGIEAEDIERAFQNVAGFLEQSARAVGSIVTGINSIVDAVTTSDEEQKRLDILNKDDGSLFSAFGQPVFLTSGAQSRANDRASVELEGERIIAEFKGSTSPLLPGVGDSQAVTEQQETNRLLAELVRASSGNGNDSLSDVTGEGNVNSGFASPQSNRRFGPSLDTGSEQMVVQ